MAAIDITNITDTTIGGEGVFDKLMSATAAHIQAEYAQNRVTGPEYAALYTSGIQAALQQAVMYSLEYPKLDLIEKQGRLLEQQILSAQQEVLVAQQQVLKIKEEVKKIAADIVLSAQQRLQLIAETNLTTIRANLTEQERQNAIIQGELLVFQKNKIEAERQLLAQKLITERAQVQDSVASSNSVIGKQNALYTAQTAGYARDAEQKITKILTDTWALRRTTEPSLTSANTTNKLDEGTIGRAVSKALNGIGL